MSRWRLVAGAGVVAALALTLIVLLLSGDSSAARPSTTMSAIPTTTTTTGSTKTTSGAATTVTTTAEQRLAEVELLLQDLWFGWFDAIYRKDADALWRVVATTTFHSDGVAAMDSMGFIAAPTVDGVRVEHLSILFDRPDCLVVENSIDMTEFRGSVGDTTVTVLWPDARYGFRFATGWQYANDLWLNDCLNLKRENTP